jgi:hypothetical protein
MYASVAALQQAHFRIAMMGDLASNESSVDADLLEALQGRDNKPLAGDAGDPAVPHTPFAILVCPHKSLIVVLLSHPAHWFALSGGACL